MQLFVILSGYSLYMYTKSYDKNFIFKKFTQLILPTYVWSYIIYFVKDFNFVGIKPFIHFPDSLAKYTKTLILHPDFIIWFLYIIFLSIFIIYIVKYASKQNEKIFNFFIISALIITFILPTSVNQYFGIYKFKIYFPIFILGYFLAECNIEKCKYLKKFFLPSVLIYFLLFKYYKVFSMDSTLIYYGISFSAIIILYNIALYISKSQFVTNILTFFSVYSLQIYLLQCICLNIGIMTGTVRIISIFIFATLISSLLAYLINKSNIANLLLFGKSRS